MTQLAEPTTTAAYPFAPATLEEAWLPFDLITDLVLKTLHRSPELSGSEVGRRLGLAFGLVEASLDLLRSQRHCEITGGPTLGGSSFRYRLTDTGHTRAMLALERNQYVGAAPVTVADYRRYMARFQEAAVLVTPDQVRLAFSHLVISERVLDEIGAAVNGGHSIFIYGDPGNGKTIMARAVRALLTGSIAVPHAIEVGGHIIRFFDSAVHEPVTWPDTDDLRGLRYDGRWVLCRRPMVAVGGELTLEALDLAYNPRSGIYHAPVQALANGGVLLIDDFGRQRCSPRDLLNWWMVPLESHVECLTLQSGDKLEMPFHPLVIFSTNLRPSDLVDEAFLRRIQYKIYVDDPTVENFVEIFARCCAERGIPFDRPLVDDLLQGFFRTHNVQLRACQPRDLVDRALSLASYRRLPRRLTSDLLDAACDSYFINDHDAGRVPHP